MCKSSQHGGHNVVPLKMIINKSDELLRKKREFKMDQKEEENKQKKIDSLLGKLEESHI